MFIGRGKEGRKEQEKEADRPRIPFFLSYSCVASRNLFARASRAFSLQVVQERRDAVNKRSDHGPTDVLAAPSHRLPHLLTEIFQLLDGQSQPCPRARR